MIAWVVFGVLLVVFVIPYVFIKHCSVGVYRRGDAGQATIALTFDDGPDPVSTPLVLEALARHGIRATFFVVGVAAEARPDLVRRIVAEGHEVGSHSYHHRHALFHRWPLHGFFDTTRGVRSLERLLRQRTAFFRPPWGAYSWSVLLGIWCSRVRPVHWTVEAHDWHPRFSADDVVRKVLSEARPGGIIVMHDAGRGAAKTVHAIDRVLDGLVGLGLLPVPLSEMTLRTGVSWSRRVPSTQLERSAGR